MPDHRHHRGPGPEDHRLFAADTHDRLRSAVRDLSWLFTRGYAEPSAIKLVGDRYGLDVRQRMAIRRSACTDQQRDLRSARLYQPPFDEAPQVLVDGYNVLTTIEAALGGAVVLRCRDGAVRDIAALHGTWRQVAETSSAAELIGETLGDMGFHHALWYLDKPVSNSGRLAALLRETAAKYGWHWTVELVPDPDPLLSGVPDLIATADSVILDTCSQWLNLAARVIREHIPKANLIDLSDVP